MMRYLASAPQHNIKNKYGFCLGGRRAFGDHHVPVGRGEIQQYAVFLVECVFEKFQTCSTIVKDAVYCLPSRDLSLFVYQGKYLLMSSAPWKTPKISILDGDFKR